MIKISFDEMPQITINDDGSFVVRPTGMAPRILVYEGDVLMADLPLPETIDD